METTKKSGYKHTLNLPRTDFPMKADLPAREPKLLKQWETGGLYAQIMKERRGRPKFILHDGPPYANGTIHMGHALNKILKDIIIKYKTMRGFHAPYVPGWDCHGLPVEHQLFKEMKITKYDIDQLQFRKKAHDYAMKYVGIQRDDFKRLGIFGDWERPYLTLTKDYEAAIVRSFARLVEKGYIYKDLKPVNWCATCETALAEAEVEYEDKTSPSIYVKFTAADPRPHAVNRDGELSFVIWTTTPWTLLANVAIALHPEFEYAYVASGKETYIIAKDLVETVAEKIGLKEYTILKTVKGKALEGLEARHPFIDRTSRVVLAGYVTLDEGTGCVHTAPGHGQEDYLTGRRYGLPTIMPVTAQGRFDGTAGEFSGMGVYKANPLILEKLRSLGKLLHAGDVTHSYPHCWRCKKPIIFRATEQYFLKIDHNGLREAMLKAINGAITWVPASGAGRIGAMVASRPDWCLSRQRYWGVPIIAFYCKKCKTLLLDGSVIDHVASLVEKEGSDAWFAHREADLLPPGTKCRSCGSAEFTKETDIIDVWFDSGVSHQAVLKQRADLDYPCELYLEGSDQHRGWFQSALITAMAIDSKPPYKSVLTHGFVVDGEGKKMSKSLGNVIAPQDVMKRYGADILRLWVASSDYAEDVRLSEEILTRLADAYRKVRNTYRYLLSNLSDFDPQRDAVAYPAMLEIDRWILSRLAALIESAAADYEAYAFHKVYRDVYHFCVSEVSSVYLDVLKDRMYTAGASSHERRSGQTAMYELLTALVKIMAPLIPFTADEAWAGTKAAASAGSVHLASWPDEKVFRAWRDTPLDDAWGRLIQVREVVLKKLEEKRQAGDIGSSLAARVRIASTDTAVQRALREHEGFLRYVFIVSEVVIADNAGDVGPVDPAFPIAVLVEKANGEKCERCWNYSDKVGKDASHPTLCERCVSVVAGRQHQQERVDQ